MIGMPGDAPIRTVREHDLRAKLANVGYEFIDNTIQLLPVELPVRVSRTTGFVTRKMAHEAANSFLRSSASS